MHHLTNSRCIYFPGYILRGQPVSVCTRSRFNRNVANFNYPVPRCARKISVFALFSCQVTSTGDSCKGLRVKLPTTMAAPIRYSRD